MCFALAFFQMILASLTFNEPISGILEKNNIAHIPAFKTFVYEICSFSSNIHRERSQIRSNNSTLLKMTHSWCNVDWETVNTVWIYRSIVTSVAVFAGNVLVILVVYKAVTLQTASNYFIVNMAISDMFLPASNLLYNIFFVRKEPGNLSGPIGTVLRNNVCSWVGLVVFSSLLPRTIITSQKIWCTYKLTKVFIPRLR